jgi:transposase
MTKARRYCSAQQKIAIAISAIKENLTQAQLTSKYGVHVSQIKIWKQEALKAIEEFFSGKKRRSEKERERLIESLYRQIGQLHSQVDWMKKKCANEHRGEASDARTETS